MFHADLSEIVHPRATDIACESGFTFVAEGTEPGGARRGATGAVALSASIATCQLRSRFCFSRVATLACCTHNVGSVCQIVRSEMRGRCMCVEVPSRSSYLICCVYVCYQKYQH